MNKTKTTAVKKTRESKPPVSRKQYSHELWTTIQVLYESGRFASVEEMHKHCKNSLPKTPSIDSIKKRSAKYNWDKHAMEERIEEKKRENFEDLFARLGANQENRARLIVEGMYAARDIRKEIEQQIDRMKKLRGSCRDAKEFLEALEAIVEKLGPYFQNLNTARGYLTESFKLCGDYSPEKSKFSGRVKTQKTGTSPDNEDLSIEDIDQELKRLAQRGL